MPSPPAPLVPAARPGRRRGSRPSSSGGTGASGPYVVHEFLRFVAELFDRRLLRAADVQAALHLHAMSSRWTASRSASNGAACARVGSRASASWRSAPARLLGRRPPDLGARQRRRQMCRATSATVATAAARWAAAARTCRRRAQRPGRALAPAARNRLRPVRTGRALLLRRPQRQPGLHLRVPRGGDLGTQPVSRLGRAGFVQRGGLRVREPLLEGRGVSRVVVARPFGGFPRAVETLGLGMGGPWPPRQLGQLLSHRGDARVAVVQLRQRRVDGRCPRRTPARAGGPGRR